MAIPCRTAKFKSANILPFWPQLPNLIAANTSGFTVIVFPDSIGHLSMSKHLHVHCIHVHMAIPYWTTKFNVFVFGPTAKFNSRQYYWLYGNSIPRLGYLNVSKYGIGPYGYYLHNNKLLLHSVTVIVITYHYNYCGIILFICIRLVIISPGNTHWSSQAWICSCLLKSWEGVWSESKWTK